MPCPPAQHALCSSGSFTIHCLCSCSLAGTGTRLLLSIFSYSKFSSHNVFFKLDSTLCRFTHPLLGFTHSLLTWLAYLFSRSDGAGENSLIEHRYAQDYSRLFLSKLAIPAWHKDLICCLWDWLWDCLQALDPFSSIQVSLSVGFSTRRCLHT
jgi:hypothetical protein